MLNFQMNYEGRETKLVFLNNFTDLVGHRLRSCKEALSYGRSTLLVSVSKQMNMHLFCKKYAHLQIVIR